MKRYKPERALALAMDPDTGAILGMVSQPGFDPNHYADYDQETINQNLPVWMSYEPGSTFKSVTFASALELELFDMFTDTYVDRGYEIVGAPGSSPGGPADMGCRLSCRCWRILQIPALSRFLGAWGPSGCMSM